MVYQTYLGVSVDAMGNVHFNEDSYNYDSTGLFAQENTEYAVPDYVTQALTALANAKAILNNAKANLTNAKTHRRKRNKH